jgi:hypothetical protein
MSDAEAQRHSALAEIGVAVLAMRGSLAVPNEKLEAVRAADKKADALQRKAACELAAVGAFNRACYKQGIWLAAGVLGVIALWIAFKVLASSTAAP